VKNENRGFTVVELLMVGWGLVTIALLVGAVYAAIHFIVKYW